MGFQVGDIIEKLKSDRRLQMIVAGVVILVVAAAVLFFGMSPSEQPTAAKPAVVPTPKGKDNATAKKQTDNKTAQSDNKTVQQPQQPAQYASMGRRDPFMPLIIPKETVERKSEKKKRTSQLEDYEIGELKLTAIVKGKEGYYALVRLPDGKSYTLRPGMLVGSNEGRVYKITQDSVIIKEKIKDERGRLIVKENPLKLRRGEE